MKKVLALTLAGVMTLGLAGCGSSAPAKTEEAAPAAETTAAAATEAAASTEEAQSEGGMDALIAAAKE